MMKKSKLIVTITLALVLFCANIGAVFAASPNNEGAFVAPDESTPVKVAITKNLTLPYGTIMPEATFEFAVTKVSVDGDTEAADLAPDLNGDNLKLEYAPGDLYMYVLYEGNLTTLTKETGDIFQGVIFPHAGVYVYEITEIPDTYTVGNGRHEVMTWSDAAYLLNVYVDNKSDGGTYVYAVGAIKEQDDSGIEGSGEKVDPTPGGNGMTGSHSEMVFTNTYVKTNGADDPDNPRPFVDSEVVLPISKTVAGALASKEQYFGFSVNITVPSLVVDVPDYYRAYVVENGEVVTSYDNADSAILGNDPEGTRLSFIMVSTSATTQFMLKDGQKLAFVDLPVGTTYDVTETGEFSAGYIASVDVYWNDVHVVTSATGNIGDGTTTGGDQRIGEKGNSVDFTNTRDVVTPTGLTMNEIPFVVMIALVIGAIVAFVTVKSRKRAGGYR